MICVVIERLVSVDSFKSIMIYTDVVVCTGLTCPKYIREIGTIITARVSGVKTTMCGYKHHNHYAILAD